MRMEITRIQTSGALELRIRGRLDGYWADHLTNSLAETMREGHDRIRLELSDVSFMSSAGIAVLMRCYKQLQRIDGSLSVIRPSPQVRTVLQMTGLADVLIEAGEGTSEREAGPVAAAQPARDPPRLPDDEHARADLCERRADEERPRQPPHVVGLRQERLAEVPPRVELRQDEIIRHLGAQEEERGADPDDCTRGHDRAPR